MKKLAAIIPLPDTLKPLLKLNGFPIVQLAVQSALDGGTQRVCVITGQDAAEVEQALQPLSMPEWHAEASLVEELKAPPQPEQGSVFFVHDSASASTNLLQGIKHGLTALAASAPQAVFVVPGDMPSINPRTFSALQKQQEATGCAVLAPTYEGKQGHPLLLSSECFEAVLNYSGEGSLEQALASFEWHKLAVEDPGILLSASNQQDFEALAQQVKKTRGLGKHIIEDLFALYQTPPNVRAHTAAVAEVALRMARQLNKQGAGLDSELCRSGGLLHDLNRLEPDHSGVAAKNLSTLGYVALASAVWAHDRELQLNPQMFTEANLVFVADKLVKETTLVKIERRYEGAQKRFPPETATGKIIQRDSKNAQALVRQYVEITGDVALLNGVDRFVRRSYEES